MVQAFVLGELKYGVVVLKLECVDVVVPGGNGDDCGWMKDLSDLDEHILFRFECGMAKVYVKFSV